MYVTLTFSSCCQFLAVFSQLDTCASNVGYKVIEFCHTIGWYDLLVTSGIDALYIS